ncbi:MAG TPA: HlyD family efflux transporter periplasmic adaptor subunit [Thermoanaerobaculia bacterium]
MSARAPALISAASLEKSAGALAARHGARGDQPAIKSTIVVRRIVQMGQTQWVVKDLDGAKYYTFDESNWALIELFDGTRTIPEIHDAYQAMFPDDTIPPSLVPQYAENLRSIDLLERSVAERSLEQLTRIKDMRRWKAEQKAEGFDIFMIPFKVVDPNDFLNRTQKYVRWLWRPPAVIVSLVLVAITSGIIVSHFGTIWAQTLELYAFLRKPFWDAVQFFVILTSIGAIHELAHGYVTKFYGGDVHDIGAALLYFMPAFYCDTSDSLLFESKWHKLWVMLAGMYIESIICCIATLLWVASYPDTLLHELSYKMMLYTGISSIFFNINPLRKIDGYYALSSVLELPELREESIEYLSLLFKRHILRLNVEVPVYSRRKRIIYLIYAPLALGFLVLIMLFIGHLFYNFFAKYFPKLAVLLLVLTLLRLFRKSVRSFLQGLRLVYIDKKELIMSRRARPYILGGAIALLLFLAVPWAPWTFDTEVVLKPWTEVRLEAPDDGTIGEIRVHEGDEVQQGQVLAVLSSPAIEAEVAGAEAVREGLRKRVSQLREAADPGGVFRSEQRGSATEAALRGQLMRQERLQVRSPIAGRVLTHRTEDLAGRFVRPGSVIAVIGDCRKLKAEIPVSERLLSYLDRGSPVSLQLRARPAHTLHGTIVQIGSAAETLPQTANGTIETIRPAETPERFTAFVEFDNADGASVPGMGGKAKIRLGRKSYLWRSWRVLSHWAQTVVWW